MKTWKSSKLFSWIWSSFVVLVSLTLRKSVISFFSHCIVCTRYKNIPVEYDHQQVKHLKQYSLFDYFYIFYLLKFCVINYNGSCVKIVRKVLHRRWKWYESLVSCCNIERSRCAVYFERQSLWVKFEVLVNLKVWTLNYKTLFGSNLNSNSCCFGQNFMI